MITTSRTRSSLSSSHSKPENSASFAVPLMVALQDIRIRIVSTIYSHDIICNSFARFSLNTPDLLFALRYLILVGSLVRAK